VIALAVAMLCTGAPDLAARIEKIYDVSAARVVATKKLTSPRPESTDERAAWQRLLTGGVYALGALSLVVNQRAEDDVSAALAGRAAKEGRTAAATLVMLEILRRDPLLRKKVLMSGLPRDQSIGRAAADADAGAP
jgi:hypothetical protein